MAKNIICATGLLSQQMTQMHESLMDTNIHITEPLVTHIWVLSQIIYGRPSCSTNASTTTALAGNHYAIDTYPHNFAL
ncbi:predicted protein [Plenodomus lingam JN3]|uniref:Uncharacterized protein n=1 Tax=Leptosphaeria maculans (strain JN3 / isolate v23.1.3 / race Av1-4-5-6-7-8) TaxID=985895 RepID=E5A767_LEPMJ|nr:predicted protein [Plenodomus lingam JN3]CBX99462.1 predicted protein [Plenodomus lingam JN3]